MIMSTELICQGFDLAFFKTEFKRLSLAERITAKEMPKNYTDKERFAAASSCIQTGILILLFQGKRRRSSPSPFISHRVLEAVASRILNFPFLSKLSYSVFLGNCSFYY